MSAPRHSFRELLLWGESRGQFINLAMTGIGLASSFLVITALSVYQYGLYQLILTSVAVASSVTGGLFDEVATNDIARGLAEGRRAWAKRLAREYLGAKFLIALLAFAALFIGANVVASYYDRDIGSYIRIASLLVAIGAIRTTQSLFFRATVSFAAYGADLIGGALRIALLAGLWWWGGLTLFEVLWISVTSAAAVLAYSTFHFLRSWGGVFGGVAAESLWILPGLLKRYGRWVLLRYGVSRALKGTDVWYIRFFLNTEAVALYAFAINILTLLQGFIPTSMLTALLPWELESRERLAMLYRRMLKYGIWIGAAAAILGLLVIPPLVALLFPKYLPVMPLLRILLLTLPLYAVYKFQKSFLVVLREQDLLAKRYLSEVVMNALIAITFLPIIGLFAVAVKFVADYVGRVVLYEYGLRRRYPGLRFRFADLFILESEDRELARAVVGRLANPRWWFRRPKRTVSIPQ